MGHDRHVEHDLRYDMADEFMEIVLGHWESWEDDAIVQDKVTGLFAQRAFSEILAERQIDLQLGYAIEEGTYKGLSFLFQVNNLNNSPYQTRQGDPFSGGSYAPERYTTYGRQILLGLNYKL